MASNVFNLGRNAAETRPGLDRQVIPALAPAHLHEVLAKGEDQAAALAFALSGDHAGTAVLVRMARGRVGTVVQGDGLILLGFDPARLTLVEAESELDLLRAGLEAARCPGVGLVLLETRGRCAGYDLTASRRLALAAERSSACVVVLRHDGEPRPSAAHTRWLIRSAPSIALEADAPGAPVIEAELLRWRGGRSDQRWRLEWDSENGKFRDAAPLSGTVVPLVLLREDAGGNGEDSRAA